MTGRRQRDVRWDQSPGRPPQDRNRTLRAAARIVLGCAGIALIALGLGLVTVEIMRAGSLDAWRTTSMLDLASSPFGQMALPQEFSFWLAQPRTSKDLRDVVVFLLDFTPVWLGCLIVGGVILWRTVR
jgi:hypothetical protein